MFAALDEFCKGEMASHLAVKFPQFVRVKVKLTGLLAGADVYEWKLATGTAWFVFGGYRKHDCELIADLAWSRSGKKLNDLDYVDWWTVPKVFPDDGICKLVQQAVVGDDFGELRSIELAGPPKELQEAALQHYSKSDQFQRTVAHRMKGIMKANSELSETEAEALAIADNTKGSRPFFKLWSQCAESVELTEDEMDAATRAAMAKTFDLLERYGVAFLQERLES